MLEARCEPRTLDPQCIGGTRSAVAPADRPVERKRENSAHAPTRHSVLADDTKITPSENDWPTKSEMENHVL